MNGGAEAGRKYTLSQRYSHHAHNTSVRVNDLPVHEFHFSSNQPDSRPGRACCCS